MSDLERAVAAYEAEHGPIETLPIIQRDAGFEGRVLTRGYRDASTPKPQAHKDLASPSRCAGLFGKGRRW